MAATNRIISYGKGFVGNGKKTEVICLRRTENADNIRNITTNGYFDNIKFTYLSKSTVKSRFFIMRRVHNFFSYVSLFFNSLKKINNSTLSIYYSSNPYPLLLIWFANKLKKGLLFKEESEHPYVYLQHTKFIAKFLLKNAHYNLFDGHLLMTKNLISYFNATSKIPHIHVPMTVELDRFDTNFKNHNDYLNYIVFTGFINDKKEGIDILLKAFAEVVKKYDSYRLHLYGSPSYRDDATESEQEQLLIKYYKLVEQLGISNFVDFKGRVNREVITQKILEAKILVLPRPDSLQAQHGFPTKLGEYLASGNPTLVTSVGEIPDYLTDNLDCYIAAPGNVESLKNKLLEIIEDYPKAKKVGLRGRKIAEIHFNNMNQTKKILRTIEKSF